MSDGRNELPIDLVRQLSLRKIDILLLLAAAAASERRVDATKLITVVFVRFAEPRELLQCGAIFTNAPRESLSRASAAADCDVGEEQFGNQLRAGVCESAWRGDERHCRYRATGELDLQHLHVVKSRPVRGTRESDQS